MLLIWSGPSICGVRTSRSRSVFRALRSCRDYGGSPAVLPWTWRSPRLNRSFTGLLLRRRRVRKVPCPWGVCGWSLRSKGCTPVPSSMSSTPRARWRTPCRLRPAQVRPGRSRVLATSLRCVGSEVTPSLLPHPRPAPRDTPTSGKPVDHLHVRGLPVRVLVPPCWKEE